MHRVQTILKRLGFKFSTRQNMSAKLPRGDSKPILSHPSTMSFVMDTSKMVLLQLINCLCTPHCLCVCVCGVLCLSLFWYALLCVLSRHPIILKRKILFLLSHPCLAILYVLWLFLTVPWAGLQCVIVVFPDHTQLLLDFTNN